LRGCTNATRVLSARPTSDASQPGGPGCPCEWHRRVEPLYVPSQCRGFFMNPSAQRWDLWTDGTSRSIFRKVAFASNTRRRVFPLFYLAAASLPHPSLRFHPSPLLKCKLDGVPIVLASPTVDVHPGGMRAGCLTCPRHSQTRRASCAPSTCSTPHA
jgi:hypothetical protein